MNQRRRRRQTGKRLQMRRRERGCEERGKRGKEMQVQQESSSFPTRDADSDRELRVASHGMHGCMSAVCESMHSLSVPVYVCE